MVGLLAGVLALVGCGGESGQGAAGAGGTGGGASATGGMGGAGNVGGGYVEDCWLTCGVDNSVDPAWEADKQVLNCTVMGVGLDLEMSLLGGVGSDDDVTVGVNSYDLQSVTVIGSETVTLLTALAIGATITNAVTTVVPTSGTTDTNTVPITLDGTPCTVCFEPDIAVSVPLPVAQGTWDLNDGPTQTLELADVTIEIDASGITLVLSTSDPDPTCTWAIAPPSIGFTVPATL